MSSQAPPYWAPESPQGQNQPQVDTSPGSDQHPLSQPSAGFPQQPGYAAQQPLHALFSKEQRAFFTAHAPEGIELDDLAVLGPINVLKLPFSPKGFNRRLVAEMWLYPDGTRILELSTTCKPTEAFQVIAEARALLSSKGVNLTGEQQTKTRTALDFFSRLLAEGKAERKSWSASSDHSRGRTDLEYAYSATASDDSRSG